MDGVALSRLQFGLTAGFHFLYPPLTIGLSWLIFWLMTRYRKSGSSEDRAIAQFWIRILALTFVVGIATGLVMEFEFGTNWAGFSRFVGDVFGPLLAAEVIFAFFLESTFLYVLVFGWKRVRPGVQWFASLMVAVGSTLSAFWILAANSWMQTPGGYVIRDGKAQLTSLAAAIFTPTMPPCVLHTLDACLITGALFMAGVSAWFLLKNRHVKMFQRTFVVALTVGFAASLVQLGLGHYHAIVMAHTQPEKLASVEGLFETKSGAPLLIVGIPDPEEGRMKIALRIPDGLSLLVSGHLDTTIKGLDSFPRDEWPPIELTFYPFHLMVYLGLFFIAFTALGLVLRWRGLLMRSRWYLILSALVVPLPFISNELGWMTTEVGRQPWVVYRVLKTADAFSQAVPAPQVLLSIILFGSVYLLLLAVWVVFVRRELERGPRDDQGGYAESEEAQS